MKRYFFLAALAGLTACGKDSKDDQKPAPIDGGASVVPGSFTSTAASDAEVSARLDGVATPVMATAKTELGLQDRAKDSGANLQEADTSIMEGMDATYATGADCGKLATMFDDQFHQMVKGMQADPTKQATATSTSTSTSTSTAADIYDTTDLPKTDARFTFHKQMKKKPYKPSGDAQQDAFGEAFYKIFPDVIEVAGGATDTQAALVAKVDWTMTGDGGETMAMKSTTSIFGDATAKTLSYGADVDMTATKAGKATAMKLKGETTLTGGATPSFATKADVTGTDETGKAIDGHFEYTLTKGADGLTATLKAGGAGVPTVDTTVKLARTGTQCTVK